MSLNDLLPYIYTGVASALAGGGIVGKLIEMRQARRLAEISEGSKSKGDDLVDRQKLTEELHLLYLKALEAAEILRREQLAYERQIAGLQRDNIDWMRLATESDLEVKKAVAAREIAERNLRECERRWSDFLMAQDKSK